MIYNREGVIVICKTLFFNLLKIMLYIEYLPFPLVHMLILVVWVKEDAS